MPDDTQIPGNKQTPEGEIPAHTKIFLEILEGPEAGKKFELKKLATSIGRKNCDITINDPTISSKHCTIEYGRESIMINDHNSTNGTSVNGEPCSSCPLQNLDEIKIGETKALFSMASDPYVLYQEPPPETDFDKTPAPRFDEQTIVMGEGMLNPELPDEFHAAVEIIEGPNKGQRFPFKMRSTVIGRKGADIVLDDDSITARHLQLEIHSKDKITVKDLASRNGTRVNGVLISAVKIRNGDTIELGKTKMTFYFRIGR